MSRSIKARRSRNFLLRRACAYRSRFKTTISRSGTPASMIG